MKANCKQTGIEQQATQDGTNHKQTGDVLFHYVQRAYVVPIIVTLYKRSKNDTEKRRAFWSIPSSDYPSGDIISDQICTIRKLEYL